MRTRQSSRAPEKLETAKSTARLRTTLNLQASRNIRCGTQDALSQRLPTAYLPPAAKIKALISPLRAQGGPLVARVGKPRDEFASTGGVTRGG